MPCEGSTVVVGKRSSRTCGSSSYSSEAPWRANVRTRKSTCSAPVAKERSRGDGPDAAAVPEVPLLEHAALFGKTSESIGAKSTSFSDRLQRLHSRAARWPSKCLRSSLSGSSIVRGCDSTKDSGDSAMAAFRLEVGLQPADLVPIDSRTVAFFTTQSAWVPKPQQVLEVLVQHAPIVDGLGVAPLSDASVRLALHKMRR